MDVLPAHELRDGHNLLYLHVGRNLLHCSHELKLRLESGSDFMRLAKKSHMIHIGLSILFKMGSHWTHFELTLQSYDFGPTLDSY